MTYLILTIAIVTEVTATMLLKASNGWEKWAFGYGAIFFYAVSGMLFLRIWGAESPMPFGLAWVWH